MTNRSQAVSREDLEEWLQSPCTLQYFKVLEEQAKIRKEWAADGACLKDSTQATGELYTKIMVQAEVYLTCASLGIEQILESAEEEVVVQEDAK